MLQGEESKLEEERMEPMRPGRKLFLLSRDKIKVIEWARGCGDDKKGMDERDIEGAG